MSRLMLAVVALLGLAVLPGCVAYGPDGYIAAGPAYVAPAPYYAPGPRWYGPPRYGHYRPRDHRPHWR